jgi:hypothetical protein
VEVKEVGFVDHGDDPLPAFVGLRGEGVGGLGNQGRFVEPGCATQRGDDGCVDASGADGAVADLCRRRQRDMASAVPRGGAQEQDDDGTAVSVALRQQHPS